MNDDQVLEGCLFADLLPADCCLPSASLLELTGDRSLAEVSFASGLIKRVAAAWIVPLDRIRCEQVRVLVGQTFGLEYLAKSVCVFVQHHPRAECDLYPGDLTLAALQAHGELRRYAPEEMKAMLAADFGWFKDAFAFSRSALREAETALADARRAA